MHYLNYLIALVVPLALLGLFLAVVAMEERTGRRFLAGRRYQLDQRVGRIGFILRHVDWGAFSAELFRTSLERAAHDVAHATLIAVRALERFLTRVVRALRARQDAPALPSREQVSLQQRAIRYLRTTVRRARKQPAELPQTPGADEQP